MLIHRHLGKHVIDQVGSRLHHAARAATEAEPLVLAAEGDQVFMKAAVAVNTREPVLQQPVFQVILELLADKPR
jgi:hypothetical protein